MKGYRCLRAAHEHGVCWRSEINSPAGTLPSGSVSETAMSADNFASVPALSVAAVPWATNSGVGVGGEGEGEKRSEHGGIGVVRTETRNWRRNATDQRWSHEGLCQTLE